MIIQAKLAKELTLEFNWEKAELDTIMCAILSNSRIGGFTYSFYPRNELTDDNVQNILQVLKKNGYNISDKSKQNYARSYVISWS